MSAYKNKTYPLRISNELQNKVRLIAELEHRKIYQQYELIVELYIKNYELEHGEIIVDIKE